MKLNEWIGSLTNSLYHYLLDSKFNVDSYWSRRINFLNFFSFISNLVEESLISS